MGLGVFGRWGMKTVLAIILAGGRGTRMGLLCQGRPKPILPFAARFRIIDFTLSNCVHSGIHDIAILLDYGRDALRDYLCKGSRWGAECGASLQILEPRSGSYEGTADAVYQNVLHFNEKAAELVLVLAADHVYRMDYGKMIAFHEEKGADVTVGVVPVPIEQAYRFGIVTTNANGRIIDFIEKPKVPEGNLASMGIYVFNKNVLIERLIEDAADPLSPHDFGYAVIPKMLSQDKVFAYEFDGYWRDIGTVEAYYEANMELIIEPPCLNFEHSWPILSKDDSLPPAMVSGAASLRNSLVSRGCIVRGQVKNSILSSGVNVAEHAVVKNSVLMSNTTIGRYSLVDRCILDEGVTVGEFCHIGSEGGPKAINWGITTVGRGVAIPSYTVIGPFSRPLPSLGISCNIQ
jgi:glucose-1-phosphate adenylyltransferase